MKLAKRQRKTDIYSELNRQIKALNQCQGHQVSEMIEIFKKIQALKSAIR
jgi:hypothetical protein